jgi:hypothetical protein
MANSRPGDWPPSLPSTSSFAGPPYCVNGYEHERYDPGLEDDAGATYPMAFPDLDSPGAWIRPEPLETRPAETGPRPAETGRPRPAETGRPRPAEMAWTEPPAGWLEADPRAPAWAEPGWAAPEWAAPEWAGPGWAAPPSDPWDQSSHDYSFPQVAEPIGQPAPWERERAARGVRTMWLIAFAVGMFVLTILVFRWYGA